MSLLHAAIVIAIVVLALGLAWYFAGEILKPAREDREARERQEAIEPQRRDIWQGFAEAHEHNPPVFAENDSWELQTAE